MKILWILLLVFSIVSITQAQYPIRVVVHIINDQNSQFTEQDALDAIAKLNSDFAKKN